MAIVWGSWVSDRFRAGVELTQSPTTVSSSTSSVTITARVYIQTKYNGWDSGINWSLSGGMSGSGSTAFNHGGSNQYTLMGTVTKTVTPSYTGTITTSVTGSVSGWSAYGGTASVSASITTAKRPITAPSGSPGSFAVARVSDTSQRLSWTMTSTTAQPITNVDVQRSTDGGAYVQIATLGNVTSYTDTGTSANHKYVYRVKARNSAGSSGWATSSTISTTPAAPAAPSAAKTATGDIVVTRPALSSVATQWEVWHAANGVWDAARIALVASGTTSWTHTAPSNTQTHTYKLKAVSAGPTLTSGFSADSNTVQLLAAPQAPTGLKPSGVAADGNEPITLTWKHNSVDTTEQTKRQVRYRVAGSPTWDERPASASTAASWDIAPGTWANGGVMEWQVRTWGAHADPSPYSASATVTVSARPTAAINVPDTSYSSSTLTVEWGYDDPEGTAQSAYEVQLLKGSTVLETITGSGTATSATFARRVADGGSYTVTVRVQDGAGLWSELTSSAFTVAFAAPPTPSITSASWDPETGSSVVSFVTPGPSEDEVEASSAQLWRTEDEPRTNALDNPTFAETGAAKVARTNLCTNPQPVNLVGWNSAGGTVVAAPWDASRTAFRSVSTGSGTHYIFTAAGGAGKAGDVVTVSATLQVPAGVWYRASVHVKTGNVYYTTGAQTLQSTGEPVRVSHTATLTADGPDLDLAVLFFLNQAGGVVPAGTETILGDVLIEKVGHVGPYFDGSTPAPDGLTYAWSGTANASASTASGLQPAGGWFVGGTGSVVQGPATDTGFSVDVRDTGYLVSPPLVGAQVGEFYSASAVVQAIPGETPPGTTVQVRLHDGSAYIADSSPVTVTVPADGSPLLVSAVAKAPASAVSALRFYVYPNSKPVRVSEPVAERVRDAGIPAGPFIEGTVGEDSWVLVADELATSSTVTDPIPPVNTTVRYRVTALSDLPSSSSSWHEAVDTPAFGVYVNGGPGFASVVPLMADPVVTDTTARDRTLVYFAGRALPVEVAGEQLSRVFAVNAVLFDDGTTPTRQDVRDFVALSGPACLRDPDGTRAFVSIGDAQVSGIGQGGVRSLSWGFTEIDWSDDSE